MKKLTLLALALVQGFCVYGQDPVESKIKSVKVFTKGAEIFRTSQIELKKGKNELKFTKLSSNLDPKTIQVSGENFTILSVRHSPDFVGNENTPIKIQKLLDEMELVADSMANVDVQLKILKQEHTLLAQNMALIGDSGIKNEDFRDAVDYLNERFKKIAHSEFQQQKTKASLQKRFDALDRQVKVNAGKRKDSPSNIFVTVESKSEQTIDMEISYSISEAGWFPAYDIRAVNTSSPIELTYKARVYQNSGIDWEGVKLSISSGNIESSGTAPVLSPYTLGSKDPYSHQYNPAIGSVSGIVTDETGQGLPQVTVLIKGSTQGVATDPDGYYNLQIPPSGAVLIYRFLGYTQQEIAVVDQPIINIEMQPEVSELDEVVVTALGITRDKASLGYAVTTIGSNDLIPGGHRGFTSGSSGQLATSSGRNFQDSENKRAERKLRNLQKKRTIPLLANHVNYQTTFVYDIKVPYDVPSTGEPQVVNMLTNELETEYVYHASPKIKENAYLVAKISNWTELNLIDGESNLYFQKSFVGKSLINTDIGKDTLNLSLGKDEGIIVKRQRQREFESQKFLSNKKRETRDWLITVINTKAEEINLSLKDQIPLSTRSNIKVDLVESSGAKHDKETGLLTWNMSLKPGEKREFRIRYSVEQPKYSTIAINEQ